MSPDIQAGSEAGEATTALTPPTHSDGLLADPKLRILRGITRQMATAEHLETVLESIVERARGPRPGAGRADLPADGGPRVRGLPAAHRGWRAEGYDRAAAPSRCRAVQDADVQRCVSHRAGGFDAAGGGDGAEPAVVSRRRLANGRALREQFAHRAAVDLVRRHRRGGLPARGARRDPRIDRLPRGAHHNARGVRGARHLRRPGGDGDQERVSVS